MESKIIDIPEIKYECYFYKNIWKIIYQDKTTNINIHNFYGYPFYIIFEHIEIVGKQLEKFISELNIELSDILPINLILKDIIEHKQNYWLNLCLEFIIKMNCLNEEIVNYLNKTLTDKIFSQNIRHKIIKILNNYRK
jgi:hypothetical protein